MAAIVSSVVIAAAQPQSVDVREALSGVFGSISLTAWICLLLPQLIANYKAKSAEGLSMAFLFVWLLGDVTNLCGALWTHLAPTAIALACYFCIADVVLISQCTYYNALNRRRARKEKEHHHHHHHDDDHHRQSSVATDATEDEPLLERGRSSSLHNNPQHNHRRHSLQQDLDPVSRVVSGEGEGSRGSGARSKWMFNTLSLLAVYAVGTAGWFVSWHIGAWETDPDVSDPDEPAAQETVAIIGLVLGYVSAVCYLCARIPQIVKNYREKSCEGLSLLFFLLSLTGNFTYGASLLVYSQDRAYLLRALPWLLGSLGTIVEDCIIFVQFRIYDEPRSAEGKAGGGGAAASANGNV